MSAEHQAVKWLEVAAALEAERDALKLALETSRVRVAALEAYIHSALLGTAPSEYSAGLIKDNIDTSALRALLVEAASEAFNATDMDGETDDSPEAIADRILNGRGK